MTNSNTNIDDYYSSITTKNNTEEWEKKTWGLKLKIKLKKADEEKTSDIIDKKTELTEEIIIKDEKIEKKEYKIKNTTPIIKFEPKKEFIKPIQPQVKFEPRFQKDNQIKTESKQPEVKVEAPKVEISIDSNILQEKFGWWKKRFFDKNKEQSKWDSNFRDDFNKFKNSKKSFKSKWFLDDEEDGVFRRSKKSSNNIKQEKNVDEIKQTLVDKTWQDVYLPDFLTVKEFSDKIWVPISKIIWEFLKNWMMVNLNTKVDFETCFIISEIFNIKVIKEQKDDVSISSLMDWDIAQLLKNDDTSKQATRAPIISIMWHVDHGKTSILDYIRKTEVAAWEAGWITQKIWAYQVERDWRKITFLDTPWHEAFSIMRARWAKLTDIAIIVVAADEWMKPQTIESINHAKQAGVPIIVAINKMDKPGANVDLIKWQMAEQWLQPEDWWWDTIVVPVSAHSWLGIDTLLEMILLVSEMQDLKADPNRSAVATVIESHLDNKLWPIATILVNAWTLKKWDCVVCAWSTWRMKFLKDYRGKNIESAWPSVPILISGLSEVVEWWDILQAVNDVETAKNKAQDYMLVKNSKSLNQFEWASLELLLNRLKTWTLKQLKAVVKTDSNWSLEALKDALNKLSTAETKIQIIHSWVGDINDSDVIMAWTSQAILIGYNVWIVPNAKNTLQNSKIEFINKKVIYHILEKVESIITWMIDIKHDDLDLWEAKVKQIFFTSKDRMVIWCELINWKVENKAKVRIIRWDKKAWSWELVWLKHWVMDVNEILSWEFGIAFKWDTTVEVGDLLEFYKVVQRK